jgi:aminomuconate-semialdehyde/2-hydroxymuconate-6-semialdehyde dehydrogenase
MPEKKEKPSSINSRITNFIPMEFLENYIDGTYQAPSSGLYLDNVNPSTGQVYSKIPLSGEQDLAQAVDAAERAFPLWSNMSANERSAVLLRLAAGIEARMGEFVQAESLDNGKPEKLAAHVDIPRAVSNFHFFATAIEHFASESHYMEKVGINFTTRRPIGIVGCISPWNLPLYLFSWKIAPALAAGNCVIAKPSEITPYTASLLGKIANEAGLPPGVLNILHGTGPQIGNAIVAHPKIKAISFTGGTATGQHIARVAAPMFKKLSLELGGKNPTVIFPDVDIEATVKEVFRSSFSNQGQICLCGSRIFIHDSIYEAFRNAFVEWVASAKVSFPSDPKAQIGAVVSQAHMEKILNYIELAKEEGGVILTGGKRLKLDPPHHEGYYISPTVIEGLPNDCRTNQEEIFGPVVTLMPFKDEAEVLNLANGTKYGLAASVWTQDLNRAHRMADRLEMGIVWVNSWLVRDLRTPFGGMKDSGVGREGGWEALRFFTEPKNIFIKYE